MIFEAKNTTALRIGGIGLPMLDSIAPMNRELKAGMALILEARASDLPLPDNEKAKAAIAEMRTFGTMKVEAARKALNDYVQFMRQNRWAIGDKATLNKAQNAEAARCFGIMQEAARQINTAATFLGKPEQQLWIRHLGSTTANKMGALGVALGDRVETHLLGLLGDEDSYGNRARTEKEMEASRIQFHEFAEAHVNGEKPTLGNVALGYIYQGAGDRTALKSYTPELDTLLAAEGYEDYVRRFTEKNFDMYLMEAGDFSAKKFGTRLFDAFSQSAIASGKPIMLGLPTDKGLILGNTDEIQANRAKVFALIDAPNTRFIGSNEEEAVAMFCNEQIDKHDDAKAAQQINAACEALQHRLQEKSKQLLEGQVQPIGFISNGVKGVWAVTPTLTTFIPGRSNPNLVNNIGSGDALFGGSLIYYINHVLRPAEGTEPILHFTEQQLHDMFTLGQRVAYEVVGQKGAQLSVEKMQQTLENSVPVQGQFSSAVLPNVDITHGLRA